MKRMLDKRQITAIIVDALLLVAGLFLKPATNFMLNNLPSCGFLEMGFMCPSCGGTRCISNFVQGNFATSWSYHPYLFFVCIYILIVILFMNLAYVFKIKFCEKVFKVIGHFAVVPVLVVGFVVFGLIRGFVYFGC